MAEVYKRFGMLPVYRSDQTQDWQKTGYYKNWLLTKRWIPRDKLVSFRSPLVNGSYTAPSQITIQKVKIVDNAISVVESANYSVTFTKQADGDSYYYWFQQSVFTSDPNNYLTAGCLYNIKFSDSNDNEFLTGLFAAIDETEYYYITEDGQTMTTEDGQTLIFE